MAEDARTLNYDLMDILDHKVIFTECRIMRDTVPEGLYVYDARHDDDGGCDICELAPRVIVNHLGTVISKEPIEMSDDTVLIGGKCRYIEPGDYSYLDGAVTLEEYVNNDW
jgi:hypothetical protein